MREAFSLVEILITLAILAILTSIAIPQYQRYVLTSKRVEAIHNLLSIRSMEESYRAVNDKYVTAEWSPSNVPGSSKSNNWNSNSYFSEIGFRPNGGVFYRYGACKMNGLNKTHTECESNPQGCWDDAPEPSNGFANVTSYIDILIKAEGDLDDNNETGKIFSHDEIGKKVIYVNFSEF
ncbi:type IV pilin protein [Desulfurobacterium crinifex]